MLKSFKATAVLLILITSITAQAKEDFYFLPTAALAKGKLQFYNDQGKPIYATENPKVKLKDWTPTTTWSYYQAQIDPGIFINGEAYVKMTTDQNVKVYARVADIYQVKPEEKCSVCEPNYKNPLFKTISDLTEAQSKSVVPQKEITVNGYKSTKIPDYGGWGRCANMIQADGTLGPWGKVAAGKMLENKHDFTRSNPGVATVCPNFEKFNAQEKFDYYLWVHMALMAEESGCNPAAESPVKNEKTQKCFNPSCTSAQGLCQLPGSWGNMKNPEINTRNCVKTFHETILSPKEGRKHAHIGVSPNSISGSNHFGPFNFEAHLWSSRKPKMHHFLGQWRDKCGPFPRSREVLQQMRK